MNANKLFTLLIHFQESETLNKSAKKSSSVTTLKDEKKESKSNQNKSIFNFYEAKTNTGN